MTATRPAPPPTENAVVLFEAIARRRQISAIYNSMDLRLSPHVLYTREEMLYLGGIVTMRRGAPVANGRLGIFKVAGLGELSLLETSFQIDPNFDPTDVRYAASTVFVVEP